MSGLGGEDDGGNGDVVGGFDVLGGTGVCRDTNVLNQCREGDERGDIGVWELVLASGDRIVSESTGEESDVVRLVSGDLGVSSSDPRRVTGGGKVGIGELAEGIGAAFVRTVITLKREIN